MQTSPLLSELPPSVAATIRTGWMCEFATVTQRAIPLDTPMLYSMQPGGSTVDVSTGVSYPTKAERARRNPKVGLLIEAPEGGPVVSISAWAAVRDADIQANALRYARDVRDLLPMIGNGRQWEAMRDASWYWARIFIHCAPTTIRWWPTADKMGGDFERWDAPETVTPPESDPPPLKARSPIVPTWRPAGTWQERAEEVAAALPPPHVTVVDGAGFPLPFPTAAAIPTRSGFDLDIPSGAPWDQRGPASLCFGGQATFVGRLDESAFTVERLLPDLPLVRDPDQIFEPTPAVRDALVSRLESELDRRGQEVPTMPDTQP